jgi:hypothetical protein
LLDTLAAHTEFEVTSADIPPTLPDLIDEPAPLVVNIRGLALMVLNLVTIPIRRFRVAKCFFPVQNGIKIPLMNVP